MNRYRFSPTLLDKFESYVNSSRLYQSFYGFSEEPPKTEEEFEQEQFQGLIDSINRVPFQSEAADKGTAFNEVVDCIIENRKSDKMEIKSYPSTNDITVFYNNQTFNFPMGLCIEFAKYFEGALTQQWVRGELITPSSKITLIGCIDELLPFKIADIKTTSKYSAFKFRHNWQHIVYPFCLHQNGIEIKEFEYTITDFKNTWTELYVYDHERDSKLLLEHCELFIEFLEANRHLIIDQKIFSDE